MCGECRSYGIWWCCESSHRSEYSIYGFFFFNDTATTEIYTLSLHDALPISVTEVGEVERRLLAEAALAMGMMSSSSSESS